MSRNGNILISKQENKIKVLFARGEHILNTGHYNANCTGYFTFVLQSRLFNSGCNFISQIPDENRILDAHVEFH